MLSRAPQRSFESIPETPYARLIRFLQGLRLTPMSLEPGPLLLLASHRAGILSFPTPDSRPARTPAPQEAATPQPEPAEEAFFASPPVGSLSLP